MTSPFMTQRTKSKFVFASPARTAEALLISSTLVRLLLEIFCCNFVNLKKKLFVNFFSRRYVNPEHIPIQYGGLSVDYCDCNPQFTIDDLAAVVTVKSSIKQTVEIIVNEG